ncbi:MAG: hypothetical protein ACXVB9_06865 [Bdellovibrionota bacterium]
MLKVLCLLALTTATAQAAAPATPRKMHCVCCALSEGQLLDGTQGSYCGGTGGPNSVTFFATPDNYKEIGAKLCWKNVVDQSQDIYVTSCGYVD